MSTVGNFSSLRFPGNLGSAEVPNYITFRPQSVQYGATNIDTPNGVKNPKNAKGGRNGPFSQLSEQIGGTIRNISDAAIDSVNQIGDVFTSSNFTSAATKLGKVIKGKVRVGDFILSAGIETNPDRLFDNGSISLYLPNELSANLGVDYSQEQIGAVGAAAVNTVVAQGLKSGLSSIEGAGGVENLVKGALSDLTKSGPLRSAGAIGAGRVANPFSYSIFNGVQHRTFDYSFTLISRNASESKVVKDIVNMFYFYMLPGRGQEQDFHFLQIPVQWKIEYLRKGNPLDFHLQPRSCFLQSANVTYGGDATNNLHSDGSPIQTTVALSFVEIEPLYRETINDSFNPPRNLS